MAYRRTYRRRSSYRPRRVTNSPYWENARFQQKRKEAARAGYIDGLIAAGFKPTQG